MHTSRKVATHVPESRPIEFSCVSRYFLEARITAAIKGIKGSESLKNNKRGQSPLRYSIETPGIAHVQGFNHVLQALLSRRGGDELNVIGHQAIGEKLNLVRLGVLLQLTQIGKPIFIGKKDIFAAIDPLSDVMGYVGADGPGKSRHRHNLSWRRARNKE